MSNLSRFVSIALAAIAVMVMAAPAAAQPYPPATPQQLVLAAASSTVAVGGSTTLSVTILDAAEDPISGAQVAFTIVSEPGTDAAVGSKSVSKATDSLGIATTNLYVGTTPGNIVVMAESGSVAQQITVSTQAPVSAPVPAPVQLPTTGGTPASAASSPLAAAIALVLGLSLCGTGWLVIKLGKN